MGKYMKVLTLTALVAGLLVLPLILRKPKAQTVPASDEENGYDSTDDTVDWDL